MNNTLELGLTQNDGSDLMPEVINGEVDARSVHEALQIGHDFRHWIKNRIDEFGFVEGQDFRSKFTETPLGGRPRKEYILTLDMAKELAMVERNEMGRKMRRYFIECEKRLSGGGLHPPGQAQPGLSKLEGALVDLAREHDGRIAKLESQMRPGEDWQSPRAWLGDHGFSLAIACGRLAKLSQICTARSAVQGFPIGRERYPLPGGGMQERRTFAPQVLAEVIPPRMLTWQRKDMEKGGQPA